MEGATILVDGFSNNGNFSARQQAALLFTPISLVNNLSTASNLGLFMARCFVHIFILSLLSLYASAQNFSNKGTEFWVGYGYHQAMNSINNDANAQDMILYFTSDVAATVTVDIPGVGWTKTYQVAANAVTESDPMPKSGAQDARLSSEGSYNSGIHITSTNPIVAYAHIYSSANSAASLLFPVNTLGQDYYSLNFTQKSNIAGSNSWAFVIATEDNTMVEITPSANTLTHSASQAFTVPLNKGQIYNLMGTTSDKDGVDLTGTRIRSVSSGAAACKRIAVFSGSGRVSINCENAVTSSDNLFQQVFPQSAWGKKFLTVPTLNLPNNYFRIAVSDPSTVVTIDGVKATNLAGGFYYEINANAPKSIVSDKPVTVAQYITSSNDDVTTPCGNSFNYNGDPEMIYLSPLEQTIEDITLNSTPHFQINSHYINVVIKTSAVNSFTLDGAGSAASFKTHPGDQAYSFAVFEVKQGSHHLKADSGFNAIAYGYGQKESYGYNAGTNIKNLYEFLTVQNPYAISLNTCANTPFSLAVTLPYKPTSLVWDFSNNPNLTPATNIPRNNPNPDSTYVLDGKDLYVYKAPASFKFNVVGKFPVKILATNQSADGCNGQQEIDYDVEVVAPPTSDFTFNHTGCATDSIRFVNASAGNGHTITKWLWGFSDNTIDSVENPLKYYKTSGMYNVKLTAVNDIGCAADAVKPVTLAPQPVAKFGFSSPACVNNAVTFTDSSTIAIGNISKWHWNFGTPDSVTTNTNAPVAKTYSLTANYNVSLQVEDVFGCRSNIATKQITVHSGPFVDFNMPGVCLPSGIAKFTNLSSIAEANENPLSFVWDFGDGATSVEKDASHPYKTADLVKVILKATSVSGCAKDTSKVLYNIFAKPHANFTTSVAQLCLADSVRFTDASVAPKSSASLWFWNFGDGTTSTLQNPVKKYVVSGNYIVTLYITTASGCVSDTAQKTIIVNKSPIADFTVAASGCEKQPVTITSQSSSPSGAISNWSWDFGDGTTANNTNGTAFPKTYENPGTFVIKLTVQSDNGCKSDTVQKAVSVVSAPVSNFITPQVCVNDPVAGFLDSSYLLPGSGSSLSYSWNFGDQNATPANPNISTAKNPEHHFSAPGSYNVTLATTSDVGCVSTITKTFAVNGIPEADFLILDSSVLCSNSQIHIQNNSSVTPGAITKIEITWDVDSAPAEIITENSPRAGQVYSHVYPSLPVSQTYKIRVQAFSGINCSSEKTLPITIAPSPKVLFTNVPAICSNENSFKIIQAKETLGLQGTFAFSGNGATPEGLFSPSVAGAGETEIKYTFTSEQGCKDSAVQTIRVIQNPTVELPPKVFVLEGGSVILEPVITGNISKFNWTPATWLDNPNIQTPRSTPERDTTYRLTASSPEGCAASDDVNVVFLKNLAVPNAFSPNGDGINDVWNVPALQSFENCTVQVFNRYGKIVYTSRGYRKPWDGSFNGSPLPVGVYYYIINIGNGKKPYSGYITILK